MLTLTPPFCPGCVFPSEKSAVSTKRQTRNVQSRGRHGNLQVDVSISCRTDMLDVFRAGDVILSLSENEPAAATRTPWLIPWTECAPGEADPDGRWARDAASVKFLNTRASLQACGHLW